MRSNSAQVKKRILIITAYTKPINMGGGSNAEAFADFLNKKGYSAKVLSKTNTGFFYRIDKNKITVRWPNSILLKILSLLWIFPFSLFLCSTSDIVFFVSSHYPLVPFLMLFCKILRKKVVFRSSLIGDDDPLSLKSKNTLYSRISLYAINKADIYHSINPAFTESYIKTFNTSLKIVETTQGVDNSVFTIKQREDKEHICKELNINPEIPIILSVGFLINRKGFREMFEILAEIKYDYTYLIVGDYKLSKNHPLYFLNKEMNENYCFGSDLLKSKVRFLGPVADIKKIYAIADVLFMNSYAEGTPNVLLEAMSMGVVPIVRELPGYRDFLIVNNNSGFLFTKIEEANLILENILDNDKKKISISKSASIFALNNFSFEEIWRNFKQIERARIKTLLSSTCKHKID